MNTIQDTATGKYLDFDGATDIKVWVESEENAHQFTDEDCSTMLAQLNTEAEPERFVGRPKDRQPK